MLHQNLSARGTRQREHCRDTKRGGTQTNRHGATPPG